MRVGPGHVPHRGRSGGSRPREVHPALDPVEPGHEGPLVAIGRGQEHARADQFELEAGRGGPAHLRQPFVDEIGGPAELGGAEHSGLGRHPLHDIGGSVDEPLLPGVGHGREDDEIPQPLQQVGDEPPGIVSALDDPVDDLEGGGAVPRGEGLDHGVEQRPVRITEQ